MTQWKVANSSLFAILQALISLDKGFCTKGELNKQYQKYIQSQRFYDNNLQRSVTVKEMNISSETYIFVAKHHSLWGISCPGLYNTYGGEVHKSEGAKGASVKGRSE